MKFNFFGGNISNNLELVRTNYIRENKLKKEIKMLPCSKYIACQDKLSKEYLLALTDHAEIETMKVASFDDVEFYEGYEIVNDYTDELRKLILKGLIDIYECLDNVVRYISIVEIRHNIDKRYQLNDNKLKISTYMNIINNIYQNISMSDNGIDNVVNNLNELENIDIENIISFVRELIDKVVGIDSKILIEYINRHLRLISLHLMNFLNDLIRLKK